MKGEDSFSKIDACFWHSGDQKIYNVQLTFEEEYRKYIENVFVGWARIAEGYDPQGLRNIIIFRKSFSNQIHFLSTTKALTQNNSLKLKEVK